MPRPDLKKDPWRRTVSFIVSLNSPAINEKNRAQLKKLLSLLPRETEQFFISLESIIGDHHAHVLNDSKRPSPAKRRDRIQRFLKVLKPFMREVAALDDLTIEELENYGSPQTIKKELPISLRKFEIAGIKLNGFLEGKKSNGRPYDRMTPRLVRNLIELFESSVPEGRIKENISKRVRSERDVVRKKFIEKILSGLSIVLSEEQLMRLIRKACSDFKSSKKV